MSDIALRVENLSKLYHIGRARERHDTLRDQITDTFTAPFRRIKDPRFAIRNPQFDTIWALNDVSFKVCPEGNRRVKRGEVVGIIYTSTAPRCAWA